MRDDDFTQALFSVFAALQLDPSSEFYVLRTSAEPDKFVQWAFEGIGAVIGRSLVGEKLAYFCSNAQVCCRRRHMFWPRTKRINIKKGDVHADESFKYDNCAADSSDDEEEDDEDENFDPFATADAVATVDESYAAQLERYIFAITDAYAARGRRLEPACVEKIVEVIGKNVKEGITGVLATAFLSLWVELVPGVAQEEGLLTSVDACDLAARTHTQRDTLRGVLELLEVPRAHRDGQTVDAERLELALPLEHLLHDAGAHRRTDGLASWNAVTIFKYHSHAKAFYFAALDAGYDVSRTRVIELDECLRRVEGLHPNKTFPVLVHALQDQRTQHGGLLREATVLVEAVEASFPGEHVRSVALKQLLSGNRDDDPELDAALTLLEVEGFHTGPVAALDDVLDPEWTQLCKGLRDACGIKDETNLIDALRGLKSLSSNYRDFLLRPSMQLLIEAVQEAPGTALQNRDVLRKAAEKISSDLESKFPFCRTLQPILNLMHYAGADEATLKTKKAFIEALDETNAHGRNVSVITYDVFIAEDTPAYVSDLAAAGKKAGLSFTDEDAATLHKEVEPNPKNGLNGCNATFLLKVLTALLRAGPCNGRALENEEDVATACIAAGFNSLEVLGALKHLLEPLKHEDGPKPRKAAKAKIWDKRRLVAPRVADLLHAMGIHLRGVTFASYGVVQKKWKKKYDDLEGSSSDSEPEPEAKRPKRS